MNIKKQIVLIHGGMTFDTYEEYLTYLESYNFKIESLTHKDWKDNLESDLPDFEVIYPKMPNSKNAKYKEWKIWFEKIIPFIKENVILVGHSLGGIFLAKYLSENIFPKNIDSLHLVAAPYDTEVIKESLADFSLNFDVSNLSEKIEKIFLYQSKDDTAVAYEDVQKYKRDLPASTLLTFDNRGHFKQEKFPELVENILNK